MGVRKWQIMRKFNFWSEWRNPHENQSNQSDSILRMFEFEERIEELNDRFRNGCAWSGLSHNFPSLRKAHYKLFCTIFQMLFLLLATNNFNAIFENERHLDRDET